MEKRLNFLVVSILVSIVAALFLTSTGCMGGIEVDKTIEDVDPSTRIVTTLIIEDIENNYTQAELQYIMDEKLYKIEFPTKLRPALDYLRANAKPSDKVLSWWDNGHILRGYARREPIVYTPTYSLLSTVRGNEWDEAALGQFASEEDMTNVAYALLADSPAIAISIMKRYNAKWTFVSKIDRKKIFGMATILGENLENYIDELGDPKPSVMNKMIFLMSDGWSIKGFDLVYEDDYAFIYKLKE
ncbi:MAG: hypothetical protein V1729_04955 [Candidatus Woesearchaeota archaeon]